MSVYGFTLRGKVLRKSRRSNPADSLGRLDELLQAVAAKHPAIIRTLPNSESNCTKVAMWQDLFMLDLCHIEVSGTRKRLTFELRARWLPMIPRVQTCQRAPACQRVSAITPRTAPMSDPAVGDARHRADHLTRYDLSWRCLRKATRAVGCQVPLPHCGSLNLLSARPRILC